MDEEPWLTAEEAAQMLGVQRATVYAYVSRGMIRAEPVGGNSRARRYLRADVARLKQRRQLRRDPERVDPERLHWGTPVLDSALTLIQDGALYYRGVDAVALARRATFEEVAGWLWFGTWAENVLDWDAPRGSLDRDRDELVAMESLRAVDRFQAALPLLAARDVAAYNLEPAGVAATGARIVRALAELTGDRPRRGRENRNVAATLQRAWGCTAPDAARALDEALVVCADHELNASSFTARCVASAGATPYAVVQAGLAALSGRSHGGMSERIESLFDEVDAAADTAEAIGHRLRRGEPIWGFGHPLYPEGDPRATYLLAQLGARCPRAAATAQAQAICDAVWATSARYPNVDFALVALRRALDLPPSSALTLFAVGRTAGWIAHAMEQYRDERLIRPRARYVGPPAEATE